jgi:hypothetical protein
VRAVRGVSRSDEDSVVAPAVSGPPGVSPIMEPEALFPMTG